MTCGKDARDDCAGKVQIATQVQGEGTQGTCIHLLDTCTVHRVYVCMSNMLYHTY